MYMYIKSVVLHGFTFPFGYNNTEANNPAYYYMRPKMVDHHPA